MPYYIALLVGRGCYLATMLEYSPPLTRKWYCGSCYSCWEFFKYTKWEGFYWNRESSQLLLVQDLIKGPHRLRPIESTLRNLSQMKNATRKNIRTHCVVSRSQTLFFFCHWVGKKGSGERSIAFLFWLPPDNGGSTMRLRVWLRETTHCDRFVHLVRAHHGLHTVKQCYSTSVYVFY